MPKKILIVDDSSTALMMETMILSTTGYELVTASDGQQAVEKARSESPDLILMDVVMPNKSGFEACREVRADALTSHIPVILVTTRGEEEAVEAGFSSGCNDYITKPVNAQELVLLVKSYLDDK